MKRIPKKKPRLHNSRYFSFKSSSDYYDFYKNTSKASKYVTKKIKGKAYMSARVTLPSKFFEINKVIKQKYCIVKLGSTHIIQKDKEIWGYSYLLFILGFVTSDNPIRIDTRKNPYIKLRNNYSRIADNRSSKDKKYPLGKIILPSNLINKNIHFIKIKNPIELIYDKISTILDNYKYSEKIIDIGQGYVLFYPDKKAKYDPLPKEMKENEPSYKITLRMLFINKFKIQQISTKRKLKPTSIWNHVAKGFKKEEISLQQLKQVIIDNCNEELRYDMVIFLEILRKKEHEAEQKLRGNYQKNHKINKLTLSKNEIKEKFYKENKKKLPINMLECMTLYMNSIS